MLRSKEKISLKAKNLGKFSTVILRDNIKKKLKKKHKIRITEGQINKVWRDWVEEEIIKPLSVGSVVQIDSKSKIWVKATPTYKHKRAMSLRSKGLAYRNGKIVEADINFDTSNYIYKVVYENISFKQDKKIFFKSNVKISKAVNEGIINGKLITRF